MKKDQYQHKAIIYINTQHTAGRNRRRPAIEKDSGLEIILQCVKETSDLFGGQHLDTGTHEIIIAVDGAADAAACAVGIQNSIRNYSGNIPSDNPLSIRIGMDYGEIRIHFKIKYYRVTGEPIIRSAYLESQTIPGGITCSPAIYKRLTDEWKAKFGITTLIERNKPKQLCYYYRDFGKPDEESNERDAPQNKTPRSTNPDEFQQFPAIKYFTGRTRELNDLMNQLSVSRIFFIHGIMGAGKTALMSFFVKRSFPGHKILWIRLDEEKTFYRILGQLSRFMAYHGSPELEKQFSKEPVKSGGGPSIPDTRNSEPIPIAPGQEEQMRSVIRFLNSTDSVICIDDYHKLQDRQKPAFRDFLRCLDHQLERSHIFITTRERPELNEKHKQTYVLNEDTGLQGLDTGDTERLFRRLEISPEPGDIAVIHRLTTGLPITIELISALMHTGKVTSQETIRHLKTIKPGEPISDFLTRELFFVLPKEERELLKFLSVFHIPIDKNLIDFIDPANGMKALKSLNAKCILIPQQSTGRQAKSYSIHDIVRRIAQGQLGTEDYETAHRKAADYYLRLEGEENALLQKKELYRHFFAIKDFPSLVQTFKASTSLAFSKDGAAVLAEYIPHILAGANPEPKLRLRLLRVLASSYHFDEQYEREAETLLRLLEEAPEKPDLLRELGNTYHKFLNQPEKALAYYSEALQADSEDAETLRRLSAAYQALDRTEKAQEYLHKAAEAGRAKADFNSLADTFLQMKDFVKAFGYYQLILKKDPKDFQRWSQFTECARQAGLLNQALEFCLELTGTHPFCAEIFSYAVNFYCELGQYSEAIRFCLRRITEFPKDSEALKKTAYAYACAEAYTNAIEYYERAMEHSRDHTDLFFKLADCHYHLREFESAKLYYIKGFENPEDFYFLMYADDFTFCCQMTGDIDTALSFYRQMIYRLPRREPFIFHSLIMILIREKRTDEALSFCESIREKDPSLSAYLAGTIYFYQGQYPEAVECAEQVLLDARNTAVYDLLYQIHDAAGNPGEAKKYLQMTAAQQEPAYRALTLSEFYRKRGDSDKARDILTTAINENPTEAMLMGSLGRLYQEQKQYEKALEIYQRVIEHNPKNVYSIEGIADCYAATGQTDKAEAYYAKAVEIQKEFLDAHPKYLRSNQASMAQCCLKAGRYEESIGYLKEIVRVYRYDVNAMKLMSQCYAMLDKADLSIEWLEKALENGYRADEEIAGSPYWASIRDTEPFVKLTARYFGT